MNFQATLRVQRRYREEKDNKPLLRGTYVPIAAKTTSQGTNGYPMLDGTRVWKEVRQGTGADDELGKVLPSETWISQHRDLLMGSLWTKIKREKDPKAGMDGT